MKITPIILFLFINFNLISLLNEESIFNNPSKSNKTFNPINYKIIIISNKVSAQIQKNLLAISEFFQNLQTDAQSVKEVSTDKIELENYDFTVLQHYDKSYYNSYIISSDFFGFKDNLNVTYIILENKLYKLDEINKEWSQIVLENNPKFYNIDYINGELQGYEVLIIYGKENEKIFFYYINSNILLFFESKKIDGNISCKLFQNVYIICIYSINKQIELSILNIKGNKNLEILYTYNDPDNKYFSEINEPILYDTNILISKLLCGRKKDDISKIICCILICNTSQKEDGINFNLNFYDLSEINANFSSSYNNCNYTIFNSEYLICCGNTDVIYCERRDMELKLINLFNITFYGKIKNLTLESHHDTYAELLFLYETSESKNIYEYRIYPPKCIDINIYINNQSSFEIDLNKLFKRKTNTTYYITILEIKHNKDEIIKLNGEDFNEDYYRKRIRLKPDKNSLYFKLNNFRGSKNFVIKYNISIEETYSDSCTMALIFAMNFVK